MILIEIELSLVTYNLTMESTKAKAVVTESSISQLLLFPLFSSFNLPEILDTKNVAEAQSPDPVKLRGAMCGDWRQWDTEETPNTSPARLNTEERTELMVSHTAG